MPTIKPRYMVTDTGPIAEALDIAGRVWPDVPRGSAAIAKLVTVASSSLEHSAGQRALAVDALSQFGGAYQPGYLDQLHEEWPR